MKRLLSVSNYAFSYDKPTQTYIVIDNICTIERYFSYDKFYYDITFGANQVVTVDEDTYWIIERYFTSV